MNRRILTLVLALLLGGLVSALVYGQLNRYRTELERAKRDLIPVVVAARDLDAYSLIGPEDIRVVKMPRSSVPEGQILAREEILGKATLVVLTQGDLVLAGKVTLNPERLGMAFQLPEGQLAIAVPVDEVVAAGGFIRPGDFVDVIHTWRENTEQPLISRLLLSRIKLLALGPDITRREQDKTKGQKPLPKTAVLQVDPEQATRVAWAQAQGAFLLALRPTGDESPSQLEVFKGFGHHGSSKGTSKSTDGDARGEGGKSGSSRDRGPWKIEMISPGRIDEVRVPIN